MDMSAIRMILSGTLALGGFAMGTAYASQEPVPNEYTTLEVVAAPAPVITVIEKPVRVVTQATRVSVPEPQPEPTPAWGGNIPNHYGEGSGCTREQASIIAIAMWAEGANDDSVEWMLGTISRESHCNSSAYNGNRNTGDNSYGLCQLNTLAGFFRTGQILDGYDYNAFAEDFQLNAQACARLWAVCGKGPWNYGNYYCSTPSELR